MSKSSEQHTPIPYAIIAQTSRESGPQNPLMSKPVASGDVMEPISFQNQPEQQSQAHENFEGQRRAMQLIEDYANDINEDEYEFDDEIRMTQQPLHITRVNGEPWEEKQDEQQGVEDEEDDLIITPQPGSDEAREQSRQQQQAQAGNHGAGTKPIQPHDLPDKEEQDDESANAIKLQQQPEQQAQSIDSSSTC